VNVASQAEDPDSLLTLSRRLLRLRREDGVLRAGGFEPLGSPEGTYAFRRVSADGQLRVALNLSHAPRRVPGAGPGRVLVGTHRDRDASRVGDVVELRANEALIVDVEGRRAATLT
jgi:glycosidase